jgi:hypothetical protein
MSGFPEDRGLENLKLQTENFTSEANEDSSQEGSGGLFGYFRWNKKAVVSGNDRGNLNRKNNGRPHDQREDSKGENNNNLPESVCIFSILNTMFTFRGRQV